MKRTIAGTILICTAGWLAFGQTDEPRPKFEAVDAHISAKTTNPFVRQGARAGRYEVKTATMVDLVRMAYGFDADKVLGGPNWLEMDRFDVIAKLPPDATPEAQKLMLQSALEDRFKLVVHKDTKPLPTYALLAGKKPQLKEADGTEEPGCKPQSGGATGGEGTIRMMSMNQNGTTTTLTLGPGMTVNYACRDMSMASFATNLKGMMMGTNLGTNPILDQTGLTGKYNFDIRYSIGLVGPMMQNNNDRITIFEAMDKQLGLKLEEQQVPTPVIVVDSVNQKPSPNPPEVAQALPPIPTPTEFEVASVKAADPAVRMSRYQMQAGGRLTAEGMPLRFLISRAFNANNNDAVTGVPPFADSDRYDIIAKTSSVDAGPGPIDNDAMAPLMRALLVDRFKMTYHNEERPVAAYSLVAAKPKMKKADPNSRTYCRNSNAPAGSPPGTRLLTCQNITMTQFAERLQGMTSDLSWPVMDTTELQGGWDFTLTFSQVMMAMRMGDGGGGMAGPAGASAAADPTGGYTLFEAIEKQLGLKLEKQKRNESVVVIDHLERNPTEN